MKGSKGRFSRFTADGRPYRKPRLRVGRVLTLAALVLLPLVLSAQDRNVDDFFRDFTTDWVRHDPNLATRTRYFSGDEQDRLERQLTPLTLKWRQDRIQRARRGLAELAKFDRARMTETQRISADVMQFQLDIIVRGEPYLDYTFPLEQFNGANVDLVSALAVTHAVLTEGDAENYLAALGEVGARMGEAVAEARRLAAEGILPPRFILQATIKQMQEFTAVPSGQNPLVTAFARKMSGVNSISDTRREELRGRAEQIVGAQVYPAWKEATALLESQTPKATDDAGLWRFKNGSETYAYNLRRYTTTNLTADQIHKLGLEQVQRLETQMDGLLRRLGRTEGSVNERIAKLREDMSYPNPTSEASRAQIIEDIKGILADAQRRSSLLFDKQPKAAVIVQPYPPFQEANAAASYSPPPMDGSRPGIFQFPLRPDQMTKFGLRSVVYHETVPGHHFQVGLQLEDPNLPRFWQLRTFGVISAASEGWGLYAERLANESGWYDGDPEGLLGQLNYELFRARRLVVDTGIHAKHWTRQQAIDYGIEPSEVERYVVFPGQACSYMIGELKIIELRDKAKKTLGDKFSFYGFHDAVLGTGSAPLDVVEAQVNAYIRSAGGKP